MNEKEFENILVRYPELIEEGLLIKGRQVNINGKFVDLIFQDRHGQQLIVEIKKGTIKREHLGQLMDYEGHYLSKSNPTVRVMLIGNRVPPNFRNSLEHHGFEWREIDLSFLREFLEKLGDAESLKCFNNENEIEDSIKKGQVSVEKTDPISDMAIDNYIDSEINGPKVKNSTNTLFRQHKEIIDNEHLFFNFLKHNWMDQNGISKRAVVGFSRKTLNLIIIPELIINKHFFHRFFEIKNNEYGYSIKTKYKDFERNKPVVGLKFKIIHSQYLRVSLEAYRASTSRDIDLFSLPQEYWSVFMPSSKDIENDLTNEINRRLSIDEIAKGKGINIL